MNLIRRQQQVLQDHFGENRQMAFLAGPRQVGKTTAAKACADHYLDWDNDEDRDLITAGPNAVARHLGLDSLLAKPPIVVFDELHKYPRWKTFVKGMYDSHGEHCRIIVTGSSRLDIYRRGGDSLMGRYFLYHMHPLSIGEIIDPGLNLDLFRPPQPIPVDDFDALMRFGGFPEPYLKRNQRFSTRWQALRQQQLYREDLRELTQIANLHQLEDCHRLLSTQSGERLVIHNVAQELRIDDKTAKRWIETFCDFHIGFLVRPWFRNVAKALRKEPKWFLRDWSGIKDDGKSSETFIACHLLKAVETWTDLGLGAFELRYVRDTNKREVDFLIIRDDEPWILIEAKHGNRPLSPHLAHFQKQTKVPHAIQINLGMAFVDGDFTQAKRPIIVPGKTFLSQLP